MERKLLTVVGARPQFVKAAAVTRAISRCSGLKEVMVHTGQHYDPAMSAVFFAELGIPNPAYALSIHGGGHGDMTGRMLMALEPVMKREAPDAVVIYGDTNSTLAGALAAAKLHIPVFHVEAGLRSYNRRMPEEINRVMADHLSALLLCPTTAAVENLAKEGIRNDVHHVGDVMYDATLHIRRSALATSTIIERLSLDGLSYVVLTLHRAENTDNPRRMADLLAFVEREAGADQIIFPVHPRTKAVLQADGWRSERFRLIEPVGYVDMHRLLASARCVMTDSGGLQKEAYFHRIPCVTLREETEWIETIDAGWNRLWTHQDYQGPRNDVTDYGDGTAADRIANIMAERLA